MKKTIKRFRNERGLTLVELLAVIVILAIVAIIAFVFIGGIIENSKQDAHIANAQQIISAAKIHEATGGKLGSKESTIEQLQQSNHLDQVLDPWDKEMYSSRDAYVTKETSGYVIHNFKDNNNNCNITRATEQELANKGRELCKQ